MNQTHQVSTCTAKPCWDCNRWFYTFDSVRDGPIVLSEEASAIFLRWTTPKGSERSTFDKEGK